MLLLESPTCSYHTCKCETAKIIVVSNAMKLYGISFMVCFKHVYYYPMTFILTFIQ